MRGTAQFDGSVARLAARRYRDTERYTAMTILKKRYRFVIGGRMTSISLEESFWRSLRQIARFRQVTISDLIASLDAARGDNNLSSTIRVFILNYYRAMAAENLRQAILEWANGERSDLPIPGKIAIEN
jgi:predicted DNA-binding ribbon-helix-helix protein